MSNTPRMDKIVLEPIGILSTASRLYEEGCKLEEELMVAYKHIQALKEALEASESVCSFMTMPREYWDDNWTLEDKYQAAKKRLDDATKSVEQHAESAAKDLLKYER